MLSTLFQERCAPSPKPQEVQEPTKLQEDEQKEQTPEQAEQDRKIADILMAAELENEMAAMAEGDDDENNFEDDEEEMMDGLIEKRSHLVGKPKRKRELKAGLLREILFNKPKRHTFSGLYM